MIIYVKGDMFESPAQILVNAVNTVGVMGKGVALEFKKRYPDMYAAYKTLCEEQKFKIGSLFLWKKSEKWVLLFPTKLHWRNPSKLEYVEQGLVKFRDNWDKFGADSIAFPRLGCGNGNLNWEDVRPLMERYLKDIPMQIYIYVDIYKDPKLGHLDITEMERWLAGEGELMGFEKFRHKFWNLQEKKKRFSDSEVDDIKICVLWNFVRDVGIISKKDIPFEYQDIAERFLEVMKELGYLSGVIMSKDGKVFDTAPNAYQYIAD